MYTSILFENTAVVRTGLAKGSVAEVGVVAHVPARVGWLNTSSSDRLTWESEAYLQAVSNGNVKSR